MPTRKQINRGFYGFETDDAEFLKPSNTNPYEASASGVGFNAKFDDDRGYEVGALGFTDDDPAFRSPSWTGDKDYVQGGAYRVVDNQQDQPAGKILGGGGNVADNVGQKPRRYASKAGNVVQNRDSRGGRDRAGGR
jgi:hypothetical protein